MEKRLAIISFFYLQKIEILYKSIYLCFVKSDNINNVQ